MDETRFYSSPEWVEVRDFVRSRDAGKCSVAHLLGGGCRGVLHVHHILPRRDRPDLAFDPDNLGTSCASHHPLWEAVARALRLLRGEELPPCRHVHRYRAGVEACERKRRAELLGRRVGRLARVA